jgi:uncharacterized membrane protein
MDFHPALASLPTALFLAALLLFILGLLPKNPLVQECSRVSPLLALLGTIAVLAAYLTGLPAAEKISLLASIPDDIIARHQSMAKLTLLSCIPLLSFASVCLVRQKQKLLSIFFSLSLLLTLGLSAWSAYRGGQLVFQHGAGVQPQPMGGRDGSNQ